MSETVAGPFFVPCLILLDENGKIKGIAPDKEWISKARVTKELGTERYSLRVSVNRKIQRPIVEIG
jgi:hypothetical protein